MLDFLPPSTVEAIKLITRQNALDVRFMSVDRHMQRWAQSLFGGITLPRLSQMRVDAKAPKVEPLAPETAAITDGVVSRSPDDWRIFIFDWYTSSKPPEVIAEEMGLARRQSLYDERRLVLAYLLGALVQRGVRIASRRDK